MYVALVHVHVVPDGLEQFAAASRKNAANSAREPGIARFDLLQQPDDPTRFVLVEVYRTPGDGGAQTDVALRQMAGRRGGH